jgi:hypothetical protein
MPGTSATELSPLASIGEVVDDAAQVLLVVASGTRRGTSRWRRRPVAGAAGKIGWKIVAAAFAVPTGIAVRKALETGWRKAKNDDPPKNPAAPDTAWSEALAWAALSGIAVAAARLLAARGAAATWKSLTGQLPPDVEEAAGP